MIFLILMKLNSYVASTNNIAAPYYRTEYNLET